MLNILLDGSSNLDKKIKSALDTAFLAKDNYVRLLIDKHNFEKVEKYIESKNSIDTIKVAGEKFYLIKQMRVELYKIDYYIS